ncbi:MAG: DUF3226 domain-containing protein, partial [Romboutsia sp.]
QNLAEDSFEKKFKVKMKDMIISKKDFINGFIKIKNENINLYKYFFPNNKDKGTLENLLLEGAKIVYGDLLDEANFYIQNIDDKYKYNWSISSENKVKVGCIANVFQPGSANQSSIRRDEWISKKSITYSEYINEFYNFIVNIVNS